MPIALIIALFIGGGASFAAESALPGNALYPIKTGINENVRSAFAFGVESEAQWKVRQIERRLDEAEELIVEDKLNAKTQAKITAKLENHMEKAESKIATLVTENRTTLALDISSNLESLLTAHQDILLSFHNKASATQKENIAPILGVMNANVQTATQTRTETEAQLMKESEAGAGIDTAIEVRKEATLRYIDEVKGLLESSEISASVEEKASAQLQLASLLIEQANFQTNEGAKAQAFSQINRAHRLANEARVLINTNTRFGVSVGAGIGVTTDADMEDENEDMSGGTNKSSSGGSDENNANEEEGSEKSNASQNTSASAKARAELKVDNGDGAKNINTDVSGQVQGTLETLY